MKKSGRPIDRSFKMLIVAYYLSRCGQQVKGRRSKPPYALGVKTWREAYELFFDAMSDGRTLAQFHNSLKNARDTFDILFENGRIGWIDENGRQPTLSARFLRIHEAWKDQNDWELEAFALSLQTCEQLVEISPVRARTEGGKRVHVSVRCERDPRLRTDAVELHGLDCMACGFNFETFYGESGRDFIEVHHVVPLSEAGRTETNPETDLIVLCANCHRIVHRRKGICLSLGELKSRIGR